MHAGCGGGVDRYVDGLCRALDRSGEPYRALVFARGEIPQDLPRGMEVLGPAEAPVRERWRRIREATVGPGPDPRLPDLIASHFALYAGPVLALRRRGVRLISHFHGPWAEEAAAEGASRLAVWAKRILERRVYRGSSRVISDSAAFREVAIRRYGVRPERITAVSAGIDAAAFGEAAEGISRETARERLGWPRERRIVFTVRRITRRMGLENLIEATAALASEHPDVLVMIGGKGPILGELEARVAQLGLAGHVRLLGFIPDADLAVAYRAAEVTVVPSVALEGFGLVILESWAAGTPVLVTPVGGMPEVVRPFRPDCVWEGSGVEELRRGIGAVLAGKHRLPEGDECRTYVRRAHPWDAVARRVLEIYRDEGGKG
jgi:glycosyltransferase involved in cell wall biosynthesis